ncbi:MAG: hypothetical protein K8T90_18730 [Planctomycetes bacterium]|nr:hypothetical protein [Planctomycetota bacterium]
MRLQLVVVVALGWSASAAAALAGEVRPSALTVRTAGATDTVTFTGRVTALRDLPDAPSLTFRCGAFSGSAPTLTRTPKSLTFEAPAGATGIARFSLSLKTGRFTVTTRGVDVGLLDAPVPVTIDIGGQRFTSLFPLAAKGTTHAWRFGQPLFATVTVHVFQVKPSPAGSVFAPGSGISFVRNDSPDQDLQVGSGDTLTDSDGAFSATIRFRDPGVLSNLDVSRLLGEEPTLTRPGFASATGRDDGALDVVVFVQPRNGAGGSVSPQSGATLEVAGTFGDPSGTLEIPPGAVQETVGDVSFTPYSLGAQMPAPLPDGYVAIAGAEITSSAGARPVRFKSANAPSVELTRPKWVDKQSLGFADIRLLQLKRGRWTERPGRGRYDAARDRVVPALTNPARVGETGPVVWAARTPARRTIRGRVLGAGGAPVEGVAVVTRAGAIVSGSGGAFEVAPSAITLRELEVVQSIGVNATSTRVLAAAEAETGDVTLRVAAAAPPVWKSGKVSGRVFRADGTTPVAGATVAIGVARGVRGLTYNDGDTPGNFADDSFTVEGLAGLGVSSYEWSLTLPGDSDEFVSSQFSGNEVEPFQLLLEAQDAGRSINAGGYTVVARFTIPGESAHELGGGFRVSFDGIVVGVSDVQLPTAFEGTSSVTSVADADGHFVVALRAPISTPMTVSASDSDLGDAGATTFQFATDVVADVRLDTTAPLPPVGPAGWSAKASMPTRRAQMLAATLSGRVHVLGGLIDYTPQTAHEAYDPATNSWSARAALPTARFDAGVTAVGGTLYVIGGLTSIGAGTKNVDAYNPSTDTWTSRMPMPSVRPYARCAALNGIVYACGGGLNGESDLVEAYDPVSDTWTSLARLPTPRIVGGLVAVQGSLYAVGGQDASGYRAEVYAYSPVTDTWTAKASLATARAGPAAGVLSNHIYVTGGSNGSYMSSLEIYDPIMNRWTGGSPMPTVRANAPGAVVGGTFFVIGGYSHSSGNLSVVEAFVP